MYVPHPFDRLHAIADPATLHRHLADVVVCDAVLGNVVIKFFEGLSGFIFDLFRHEFRSSLRGRLAYIAGIHAAMAHNYAPMTAVYVKVIERSRRRDASNTR